MCVINWDQAMALAAKYNLQEEIDRCLKRGYTPEEALAEWNIL